MPLFGMRCRKILMRQPEGADAGIFIPVGLAGCRVIFPG
jgi:hypothetical protein